MSRAIPDNTAYRRVQPEITEGTIEAVREELQRGHSAVLLKRKLCTVVDAIAGDIENEARRARVAQAVEAEQRRRAAAPPLTAEQKRAKRRAAADRAELAEIARQTGQAAKKIPSAARTATEGRGTSNHTQEPRIA